MHPTGSSADCKPGSFSASSASHCRIRNDTQRQVLTEGGCVLVRGAYCSLGQKTTRRRCQLRFRDWARHEKLRTVCSIRLRWATRSAQAGEAQCEEALVMLVDAFRLGAPEATQGRRTPVRSREAGRRPASAPFRPSAGRSAGSWLSRAQKHGGDSGSAAYAANQLKNLQHSMAAWWMQHAMALSVCRLMQHGMNGPPAAKLVVANVAPSAVTPVVTPPRRSKNLLMPDLHLFSSVSGNTNMIYRKTCVQLSPMRERHDGPHVLATRASRKTLVAGQWSRPRHWLGSGSQTVSCRVLDEPQPSCALRGPTAWRSGLFCIQNRGWWTENGA